MKRNIVGGEITLNQLKKESLFDQVMLWFSTTLFAGVLILLYTAIKLS